MATLNLPKTTVSDIRTTETVVSLLTLDKSLPYAEIHGLPGALYEQNGIYFRSDGFEAKDTAPYVDEIPELEDNSPPPIHAVIEQQSIPEEKSNGQTLDTMNYKTIKLLLESYGEEWPGDKSSAIAILKGKNKEE